MRNARNISIALFIIFFIIAVGGGLFWANLNFVHRVPGGQDLVVPWKAIRNFMMDGVTPYGDLTALNIQSIIYKQPILPEQYPYLVNIPLFMLMLYLPFGWIGDFGLARAAWMIFLEVGLVWLAIISVRLAHWKPIWVFTLIILLFCVFCLPSVIMLTAGNSIILQALVIYTALRAIELGSDELAGGLVALSLLNVEATGMVFILLIIWALSTDRWRILGGIGMMLVVLIVTSLILMPTWILPFFAATLANWQAGAIFSTYGLFESWMPGIGQRLAQMLAVGALAILFMEFRAARGKDPRWLFWTVCLTAAITPLLGMPFTTSMLVFSLPGVFLVVSVMTQRWGGFGFGSAIILLAGLFLGVWAIQLQGNTPILILFYPLILTLLLYSVRWGAVRPQRLWADEFGRKN